MLCYIGTPGAMVQYTTYFYETVNIQESIGDTLNTCTIQIQDPTSSFAIASEMEIILFDEQGTDPTAPTVGGFTLTSTNLIANPSFEQAFVSSIPVSWSLQGGGTPPTGVSIEPFSPGWDGIQALGVVFQVGTAANTTLTLQQTIALSAVAQPYAFSFYLLGTAVNGGFVFTYTLLWQNGGGTTLGTTTQNTNMFGFDGQWARVAIEAQPPVGTTQVVVQFGFGQFIISVPTLMTIAIDAVQLEYCTSYTQQFNAYSPNLQNGAMSSNGLASTATLVDCWGVAATATFAPVTSPTYNGSDHAQQVTLAASPTSNTLHGIQQGNNGFINGNGSMQKGGAGGLQDFDLPLNLNMTYVVTLTYQVATTLTNGAYASLGLVLYHALGSSVTVYANGPANQSADGLWHTLTFHMGPGTANPYTNAPIGVQVQGGIYTPSTSCTGSIYIGQVTFTADASQSQAISFTAQQAGIYPTPYHLNGPYFIVYGVPLNLISANVRLFAGFIKRARRTYSGGERIWELECTEYGVLIEEALVTMVLQPPVGGTLTDYQAIQQLAQYCQNQGFLVGLDTTTYVQATPGVLISSYVFNWATFRDALTTIANQSGALFWVDYYKRLHYAPSLTVSAPFGVSSTPDLATTYPFSNFVHDDDGAMDLTEKIVEGATGISGPLTETNSTDGVSKIYYVNGGFPIYQVDSVILNGVSLTVGVDGSDTFANFTVLYDAQAASFKWNVAPGAGSTNLAITYRVEAPPLVRLRDQVAEGLGGTIRRRVAHHQKYDHVGSKQSAIDRGRSELGIYAAPRPVTTFTLVADPNLTDSCPVGVPIRTGMALPITFPQEQLVAELFQVTKVTTKIGGRSAIIRQIEVGYWRSDFVSLLSLANREQIQGDTSPIGDQVLDDILSAYDGWVMGDVGPSRTAHVSGKWGSTAGQSIWGPNGGTLNWG